jgi:uncharacterized protein YndB with AHSA1/START domain
MTRKTEHKASPKAPRGRITIEREYKAIVQDVWDLWTTKKGFESWWGPEGFSSKVLKLDLRPKGELRYAMTAVAPAQIEFMKRAGMPLTLEARIVYTEVVALKRLAYTHLADFIPGIEPYDIATSVEFHSSGHSVRMVITLDRMHNDEWTQRTRMGWESQLGKLATILGGAEGAGGAIAND